jgi:hypothetical protein
MSCEIIQFAAVARSARKATDTSIATDITRQTSMAEHGEERQPLPPPLTETCKNSRLRILRRDAWWHAGRVAAYWQARLDWHHALSCAQSHGIGDANSYPLIENGSRFDLVDKWRAAVVKQLLTPAPDGAAVTWKRAKLAGRGFSHLPTKAERIERVIADDLAFLAAHPIRGYDPKAAERRRQSREFKEAMRRRIRDIAVSRDLSDEEIKPVLRLKHEEIGHFARKNGVKLQWLLEGVGPMFSGGPSS